MGIQLNGNNDNISAVDGDLSITGIVTFSQLDVGNNIKLGNAGVVTATSYRGDGSQLTGISAGVSLSNGADNRVVTATGAAALNGEANLTYDGSHLSIATDASTEGIKITSTGNTYNELSFDANRTSANTHIGRIISHWNGTAVSYISMDAGSDTTNKDDGMIRFWTAADGNGNYERVRIDSSGRLCVNTTSTGGAKLEVADSSFHQGYFRGTGNVGGIRLGNSTNANAFIYYDNGKNMNFQIGTGSGGAGQEIFRIASNGNIGINRTNPAAPITARRTDAGGTGNSGVIAEFANSSGYGVWFGQSSASGASWGATTGDFYWNTGGLSSQVERLRIDSSGRVVVGGTSAYIGGAALAVLGTGTTPNTYGCVAIGRVGANVTNNTAIANIRLNGGSIGTRRGAEINAFADANWSDGSSQPTRLTIGTTGSSSTSATQRLIINSSGDIYTAQNGTPFSWPSNPGHVIYSDGEYRSTSANGTHIRCNRMNGDGHVAQWYRGQTNMVGYISITSSGTGYGSGSSDERTKKNIEAWDENILDKFKSLTPKKFNFNWEDDSVSKHKGYIAQNEFEKFPEAYPKNNLTDCDNEYHMFVPTDMTVYLMKGLKEAAEKIEQLEQDNLALRARVTNLEGN